MKKILPILLLIFPLHLYLLLNLQFTAWPEMFSYAFLRNNGFLLYKDMIQPYPPVLIMSLSTIFNIFGYRLWVLKAFTWGLILVNDVLVYLIAKKLSGSQRWSLAGVAFYVLLQPFLDGNMLWFDLAFVPPLLVATYLLLQWLKQPSNRALLITGGLFLGIGALIKQTAGIFLVIGGLWLLFAKKSKKRVKNLFYFLVGPLTLGLVLALRLLTEGAFVNFINWIFIYPLTKWGKFPGYVQTYLSTRDAAILLLLLAPIGAVFLRLKTKVFKDKALQLILLFLLGSLTAIYPRFSFFHFQAALAFIAILFAYILRNFKIDPVLLGLYFLLLLFIVLKPVLARDWQKEARFYGQDDIELAQTISEKVPRGELVYLLGPHSGLYTMAERLPPKLWVDNFGWYLEIAGIQEEVLNRWEQNPPDYVFWQEPSPGNWHDLGTYRPKKITKWIKDNYTKAEEVQSGLWIWKIED